MLGQKLNNFNIIGTKIKILKLKELKPSNFKGMKIIIKPLKKSRVNLYRSCFLRKK